MANLTVSIDRGGKPVKNTFGELRFTNAKWLPHSKLNFPFFVENLFEPAQRYDEVIAEFRSGRMSKPAIARKGDKLIFLFDPFAEISSHLLEKSLSQKQPFYMKFPWIYDLTSAEAHFWIYRILTYMAKIKNFAVRYPFPDWPTDYSYLSILHLLRACGEPLDNPKIFMGPWPDGAKSAVCLSHDVDDIHGYRNMEGLLSCERQFGFQATYNIPGMRYEVDMAHLKALEDEGFEIGIHGYRHRGETPFMTEPQIEDRVKRTLERFKTLNIQGYRSPALRRTTALLKILERYFQYDSSVPDTENYMNARGFNGSSIPYPYYSGKLLELPISVQQDGVLMMLGYSSDDILAAWKEKVRFLKSLGALIIVNTHPDPVFSGKDAMRTAYARLLESIKEDKELHVTTLGKINHWVREQAAPR